MQSVDAYTMFMAWTLAPHMVDTQSQTALFKSVIPVPGTPNESLVKQNVILWNARYFQKPSTKHTTVIVPIQQHPQELSHPLANSISQIWATHEYHRLAWYSRRTERIAALLYPALKRRQADRLAGRTRTCSS